eukprot:scaffold9960_cov175-Isochrysis_galbana.AAC.1
MSIPEAGDAADRSVGRVGRVHLAPGLHQAEAGTSVCCWHNNALAVRASDACGSTDIRWTVSKSPAGGEHAVQHSVEMQAAG